MKWNVLLARKLLTFESARRIAAARPSRTRWLPVRAGSLLELADAGKLAMTDESQHTAGNPPRFGFLRVPLFRLLAINLAAGVALATLVVGGLLALNPGGLRDLILADRTPGTALGLLLFGFVVTFGSAVMGSAIMAMGKPQADEEGPREPPKLVAQRLGRDDARMPAPDRRRSRPVARTAC